MEKVRLLIKLSSFLSVALMAVGFAFPEWNRLPRTGATSGLWQDCGMLDPQPEQEGSGAEPDVNSTINANLTTISTEISSAIPIEPEATSEPEPEPEAEPDCFLKSNSALLDSLWVVVPTTIGLSFSLIGFFILMISLQAKWVQIGADGHLIGSLLYLVGVASWFSDLTEIEGLEIGWALAVGLAGMICNFLIGLSARVLTKNEKRKLYEDHEELPNPYTETETTAEIPDHLTAM